MCMKMLDTSFVLLCVCEEWANIYMHAWYLCTYTLLVEAWGGFVKPVAGEGAELLFACYKWSRMEPLTRARTHAEKF